MTWPGPARPLVSRVMVRTAVVVTLRDTVTGSPPPVPPGLSLARLRAAGTSDPATDRPMPGTARRTVGGAVVLSGFDRATGAVNRPGTAEHYLLTAQPGPFLRPDPAAGVFFTVSPDPADWPVQVEVRLLPGPAYPFAGNVPRIRGQVRRPGPVRAPVPSVIRVSEIATGTVLGEAAADERGQFTAGLVRYRASRPARIQVLDGGAVLLVRPVVASDFRTAVDLTVP